MNPYYDNPWSQQLLRAHYNGVLGGVGLEHKQGLQLFAPIMEYGVLELLGITPQQAAKTLRVLAQTGTVQWRS